MTLLIDGTRGGRVYFWGFLDVLWNFSLSRSDHEGQNYSGDKIGGLSESDPLVVVHS